MEILNRQANHNYFIYETYEAGIVLTGTEIKSIRNGKCNIKDSYCIIKNGEALLLNAHISAYEQGNIFNHDEVRTRKLLLHKKEIKKLEEKVLDIAREKLKLENENQYLWSNYYMNVSNYEGYEYYE